MTWLNRLVKTRDGEAWRERVRGSIIDVNDGIVSAAGIAEGFARAGASTTLLLFAGAAVVVAGGLAAGGARYTEEQTQWEMNRALLAAERASIEADPQGEFEELVGIYEAKGLDHDLARRVADALTKRDPLAAHADAELRLAGLPTSSEGVQAAIAAGLSYGVGAALPLALMHWLPLDYRIEVTFVSVLVALVLTGWFASWLTGLPALRLIIRNVALGSATMACGLLVGLIINV
jgi:VIT1/CCC1 family predicted Fe2+/Mn2+ transporter